LNLYANHNKIYFKAAAPQFPNHFIHAASLLRKCVTEKMWIEPFKNFFLKYSCLESELSEIYTVLTLSSTILVRVISVVKSLGQLKIINIIGEIP
jgi:hypothetical protein